MLSDYDERVIEQTRAWVQGDARHNDVDDECCPDFSCCDPGMFTQDRAERVQRLNKLLVQRGQQPHHDA